jgi:hypothetical protein
MGTGPGPTVGTFWPSPRGGTHGRIPQHSPARPHAGTPDRAARRDQDPDGHRRVRLRIGLRVRVPVGQSVPVRLKLARLDLVRRRGAPGDTGAPRRVSGLLGSTGWVGRGSMKGRDGGRPFGSGMAGRWTRSTRCGCRFDRPESPLALPAPPLSACQASRRSPCLGEQR